MLREMSDTAKCLLDYPPETLNQLVHKYVFGHRIVPNYTPIPNYMFRGTEVLAQMATVDAPWELFEPMIWYDKLNVGTWVAELRGTHGALCRVEADSWEHALCVLAVEVCLMQQGVA